MNDFNNQINNRRMSTLGLQQKPFPGRELPHDKGTKKYFNNLY
jgi:hypothetical protein